MRCGCGGKTAVIDRRGDYRRRKCTACGNRFSTREIVVVRNRKRELKPTAAVPAPKTVLKQAAAPDPAPAKPLTLPRDGPHPSYYKPPSDRQINAHAARKRLEQLREERELHALENEGV